MVRWLCILVIQLYFWKESGKNVHANDIVEQRFDNITAPAQDRRQYRGLKLKNGMKVMLISDPRTQTSGASLIIGVGALDDPLELPGLVNLVGHTLMHSGKNHYRKFKSFVENHDGNLEAPITGEEVQCFTFEIASRNFASALNKFAKFFVEPYIYKDTKLITVAESLEVIDVNFRMQKLQDTSRIAQIEKFISKPNHPYNHLAQGNMYTLCPVARMSAMGIFMIPENDTKLIYTSIRIFHATQYSSNLMTLAVLGNENLDKLEEMATSLFGKLRCSNPPIEKSLYPYENHPWGVEQLKKKIYIVPLNENLQYLSLSFPTPDYTGTPDLYFAAADVYVEYCLTHQGRGTLYSVLQTRDLCTLIDFQYEMTAGIALSRILCELTDDGLQQIDTIINLIFQYIRLLNEDGPREWVLNELRISSEKAFLYSGMNNDTLEFVRGVASELQQKTFPMDKLLWRGYKRHLWRPEIIRDFLSYLRPENMNVTIVSKSFAQMAKLSKEKYFETEYKIERISKKLLQTWGTRNESINDLQLPRPNEFISENLFLYPWEFRKTWQPYVIRKSSKFEIWFKQELTKHPEMHINFEFYSSITRVGAVENTLWRLFFNHLAVLLNDTLYSPEISGVKWADWSLDMNEPGLLFKLVGLGDKLPLMLEKILSIMTNFGNDLDENGFNNAVKRFMRNIRKKVSQDHVFQSKWYLEHLYVNGAYLIDNLVNVVQTLQVSDMKKFLRKLFQRMFIRAFIYGNCDEKRALEIVEIFEKPFHSSNGLLLGETLRPRFIDMFDGSHHIYQLLNRNQEFYSYASYFQIGVETDNDENHVKSLLLYTLINNSCKDFLMPIDADDEFQNVRCSLFQTYGVQGFVIMVRSRRDPRYIHRRVEQFLQRVPELLSTFKDTFQPAKDNVELFVIPSSLVEHCERYWREISNRLYDFDRLETTVNYLRHLTLKDLQQFSKATLDPSSPRRRLLSVHIFPKDIKQTKATLMKFSPPKAMTIEDITVFKSQSSWLPYTIIELAPYLV